MDLPEEYKCSVHGIVGNADCLECWQRLHELVKDTNAFLTGDVLSGQGNSQESAKQPRVEAEGETPNSTGL